MLVSPALIPNKNIFRHDPNTDSDYYVYFSKETVRKASELYLKHNNSSQSYIPTSRQSFRSSNS